MKVRWLENLKRLVRKKLGHSRCPENPKRAGRQKLGKIKRKRIPLIRKPVTGSSGKIREIKVREKYSARKSERTS